MAYNYRRAVKHDVREWIEENLDYYKTEMAGMDRPDRAKFLNEKMWVADSVTGNASGSYFCNSARAKMCVAPNISLASEAMTELGSEAKDIVEAFKDERWEFLDVTIRCYLLSTAISEVLDEEVPEEEEEQE